MISYCLYPFHTHNSSIMSNILCSAVNTVKSLCEIFIVVIPVPFWCVSDTHTENLVTDLVMSGEEDLTKETWKQLNLSLTCLAALSITYSEREREKRGMNIHLCFPESFTLWEFTQTRKLRTWLTQGCSKKASILSGWVKVSKDVALVSLTVIWTKQSNKIKGKNYFNLSQSLNKEINKCLLACQQLHCHPTCHTAPQY